MVYASAGSNEANDYLDDLALAANFATINHLLINSLVLEAFREVIPGTKGELVYFISHNITRREVLDGKQVWCIAKVQRAHSRPGMWGLPVLASKRPGIRFYYQGTRRQARW